VGATARGVTLSLVVGGSLHARAVGSNVNFLNARGGVAARYGGLTAVDATGRHLPSALSVKDGRVLIGVNDRGARYPITIDPLVQQGPPLTPSDPKGSSEFGGSVAISANGNTALIGGPQDQGDGTVNDIGAAWVFVRSGGVWSQQGPKLLPNGRSGNATDFGTSVALSADGNTALIGGDFNGTPDQDGAAWVYTRSGSTWSQQGPILTGTGEDPGGHFGSSVALSTDGNTALIGAASDNGFVGAAYVFTRAPSGIWTQQGLRLTPNNNSGMSSFGQAVSLSGDGNTALIGGSFDNSTKGAAWVFTRPSGGSTWTQRTTIVPGDEDPTPGSNAPAAAAFGFAVDLSQDGTTALIGGDQNAGGEGAAWVYVGSGATWTEQRKLTPNGVTDSLSAAGSSVALSADGNTAAVGASNDSSGVGAALVFTRSGTTWSANGSRLAPPNEPNPIEFGNSAALAADGQTLLIGARFDGSRGAVFAFAPPNPVCSSVSATTGIGGGAVGVTLSCSFPAGAHPNFAVVGGPSHGALSGFNSATGQLTYTSQGGFAGQDSFVYHVSDQWGLSNTATATLNVVMLPVPTCSNVTTKGKAGATRLTITLKCKGPAGHSFTYGIVGKPGNGKLGKINQSNGKVRYTTHIGAQGTDRFVYNATNSGGSSKAATATIKLPRLKRINATMQWNFSTTTATFTRITGQFIVNGVPGGAKVFLSCTGKGCPIAKHTATVPKHRVCKGKGKKRKCRRAEPAKGNVDLLKFVANRHLPVGDHLIVSMVESGWIGKQYNFKILKNGQPSKAINFLAPGSATRLCPLC
jgi:hypothetical protein